MSWLNIRAYVHLETSGYSKGNGPNMRSSKSSEVEVKFHFNSRKQNLDREIKTRCKTPIGVRGIFLSCKKSSLF